MILEILHDLKLGSTLTSAITRSVLNVIGFAFVDDLDLVKIGINSITMNEIKNNMQKMINEWQKLLKVTGGTLVPGKSWFTPVNFIWKNGR